MAEQAAFRINDQKADRDIYQAARDININLTKGVDSLSTDYAVRIQNFFSEYLGTADRPVPFGGRDSDLKMLDAWLDDPQKPPYLLLAAPAGRGKSALLVNWSQRLLATREDLAIVFIPISIRFNINLANIVFAALTARLAALYGDSPPDANSSAEILRGMMSDYLSRSLPDGRKILVVLDGLDEAAGWNPGPDLFSLTPPKDLKVVVSARYLAGDCDASSWLRRLGWTRSDLAQAPDLEPLTKDGVADVLVRMGFPLANLGQRVDIVSEIYRLSEGDPLLVRLYVDDLWSKGEDAARLQPEDLQKIRPGIGGFFDCWWDDQCLQWGEKKPIREAAVRELLNLFACALGPLGRDELLGIAAPEVNLDTWMLQESLESLRRFVIGNGVDNGYVFSHPRLGSYFFDKLSQKERETLESRFLLWGNNSLKAANEGRLPKKASYIVEYYGAHLEHANVGAEILLSLVSNGWRKAWEAQEGTYSGFLSDVGRAWKAAEAADQKEIEIGNKAIYLSGAIRCALCFASVNSLSANIPSELLVLLVKNGIWNPTQGLAYARQNPIFESRAEELRELSSQFEEPLKTDVLREALAVAREIEYEDSRAISLARIVPNLSDPLKSDILREALAVAREIKDEHSRAYALAEIAPNLSDPLKKDILIEAFAVAREIKDEYFKAYALAGIVPNLPDPLKPDVLREALAVAREIRDEDFKADALADIASNLPDPLKPDVLREALAAARKIEDEYSRAYFLARIAPNLPDPLKPNVLREALAAAREIENENQRVHALTEIAPNLLDPLKTDVLREALSVARKIENEYLKADALAEIALNLPDLNEALAVAKEIKNEYFRAHSLAEIAPNLLDPLKKDILREALAVAREIKDENSRANALAGIVPQLIEYSNSNLTLYSLWREYSQVLTRRTRSDFLSDLIMLVPVIAILCDSKTLGEIARDIMEVGRWWP